MEWLLFLVIPKARREERRSGFLVRVSAFGDACECVTLCLSCMPERAESVRRLAFRSVVPSHGTRHGRGRGQKGGIRKRGWQDGRPGGRNGHCGRRARLPPRRRRRLVPRRGRTLVRRRRRCLARRALCGTWASTSVEPGERGRSFLRARRAARSSG